MKKRIKRIAAALTCLGLMTAVAVPAALAERSDQSEIANAEQRTEISAPANETNGERRARPEGREDHARRRGRPEEAAEPENAIGKDAAKEAALAEAGLTAEQVEKLRARVSDKDGTVVYRVSFRYNGQKYSFRVDPLTGEVQSMRVADDSAHEGPRHCGERRSAEKDSAA